MRAFLHRNGLSVVTLTLFVLFWAAQAAVGFEVHNGDLEEHGRQALSLGAYLRSGHFWEATGENWESEFLQMAAFVVLTARLYQRGSAESNPLPEEQDQPGGAQGAPPTPPEQRPWPVRRGGWVLGLYSHSLSLTLLGLFLLSFVIHLLGGAAEYNTEQALHGGEMVSALAFLGSPSSGASLFRTGKASFSRSRRWSSSRLFLRERGSAESKAVEAPHTRTGG